MATNEEVERERKEGTVSRLNGRALSDPLFAYDSKALG